MTTCGCASQSYVPKSDFDDEIKNIEDKVGNNRDILLGTTEALENYLDQVISNIAEIKNLGERYSKLSDTLGKVESENKILRVEFTNKYDSNLQTVKQCQDQLTALREKTEDNQQKLRDNLESDLNSLTSNILISINKLEKSNTEQCDNLRSNVKKLLQIELSVLGDLITVWTQHSEKDDPGNGSVHKVIAQKLKVLWMAKKESLEKLEKSIQPAETTEIK